MFTVGGALIAAGAVNYVQGGSTYVSTSASTSRGYSPKGIAAKLGSTVGNVGDSFVGKVFGGSSSTEVSFF